MQRDMGDKAQIHESLITRSRSLYDGTRNSMRISNIRSKLQSVSTSISSSRVFGSSDDKDEGTARPHSISALRAVSEKLHLSRNRKDPIQGRSKSMRERTKSEVQHRPPKQTKSSSRPVKETVDYEVKHGDTLTSVAARFKCTPSELCQLNKLFCRNLFLGQLVKVPKVEVTEQQQTDLGDVQTTTTKKSQTCTRNQRHRKCVSFPSGSQEPLGADSSNSSTGSNDGSLKEDKFNKHDVEDDTDHNTALYLKMPAKHVIDFHRSVPGILLFTTTSLVFTPEFSDTIYTESYQIMIHLNQIRSVAVYEDDSVMYFTKRDLHLQDPDHAKLRASTEDLPQLLNRSHSMQLPGCDMSSSRRMRSCFELDLVEHAGFESCGHKKRPSQHMMADSDEQPTPTHCLCVLSKTDELFARRHPHWFTILSDEYWFHIPEAKTSSLFEFLKTCSFPKINRTVSLQETSDGITPNTGHKDNANSPQVSDVTGFVVVPRSFAWVLPRVGTLDEVANVLAKYHRPASGQPSAPLAGQRVRGKQGRYMKNVIEVPTYEEERMALQMLKNDSVQWELVNTRELELLEENEKKRRFIQECLLLSDPKSLPLPPSTSSSKILDEAKVRQLLINLPPEAEGLDWYLVFSTARHGFSLRTVYYRCSLSMAELLSDTSNIPSLTSSLTSDNNAHLYSSTRPCILLVSTNNKEIFGAMLSAHPRLSNGCFYGNGSTYLFRWEQPTKIPDQPEANDQMAVQPADLSKDTESAVELSPELAEYLQLDRYGVVVPSRCDQNQAKFQKFTWSGKNSYFINGEIDSLNIGCSDGHCAIVLDDMLLHGRTECCETFNNPPLCTTGDFYVNEVEIWSFN